MIFTTDPTGKATHISPRWEEVTGQSLHDSMGFGWNERLHPEDGEIVAKIVIEAIKEQREFTARYRLLTIGGDYIWMVAGAIPSFGPPGRTFLGFLGSITQLTETTTDLVKAYGSVGHYTPPPSHADTLPSSPLELAADHLILAHSLLSAIGNDALLLAVKDALRVVALELARDNVGTRKADKFH